MHLIRIPQVVQQIFPAYQWTVGEDEVALTFDDGPYPESTPQLLSILNRTNVFASHFLLGRQAEKHPEMLELLKDSSHVVGHHSYSHPNGWQTGDDDYLQDIIKGERAIHSNLFRPPYGKINQRKWRKLQQFLPDTRLVMYSLMPGDFDAFIPEKLLSNRMDRVRGGDIVVLHDRPDCLHRYAPFLEEWLLSVQKKGLRFVTL